MELHRDCRLEAGGGPGLRLHHCSQAEQYTPLTLLRVAELAKAVGIPDRVINVVNGAGGDCSKG